MQRRLIDAMPAATDAGGVAGDHVGADQSEGEDGTVGEHVSGEGIE